MTESAVIRIDFTPCRGVPFYPHDTGTMRLMQVYGLHKGVPVTALLKCALTNCQGPVSAETPRVHARILPRQSHSYSSQTDHNHTRTHTMGEREQQIRDAQATSLSSYKRACG